MALSLAKIPAKVDQAMPWHFGQRVIKYDFSRHKRSRRFFGCFDFTGKKITKQKD
jgi:hypothetical protein